jgi:hypothetical protein
LPIHFVGERVERFFENLASDEDIEDAEGVVKTIVLGNGRILKNNRAIGNN